LLEISLAPIELLLSRSGPFSEEDYIPEEDNVAGLKALKILVIGAGGLGCEILKDLAFSGFKDIHVIDMDTIDLSNLNRQFLFRKSDVGKPKATVAADFIMKRVKGVKVTPYYGKIQDKDDDYYMKFGIVICGLDNIEARRWINSTLYNLVDESNPDSLKPLIDGGTEGFKGQARVIIPSVTSCFECSLELIGPQVTFPICTIANTPRLPEHCIEWASVIEWDRVFGASKKMDTDNPEHIQWLYETALARAHEFNIDGVSYSLTQGIVKNIIPAIASTNAIIAASCVNEAFKIATTCNPFLNNYMMYAGDHSVYTYTFEYQRKPNCPVCGTTAVTVRFDGNRTLQEFIDKLAELPETKSKQPSLRTVSRSLYLRQPPQLEEITRPNLDKTLRELIEPGEEVAMTDPNLPFSVNLRVELI